LIEVIKHPAQRLSMTTNQTFQEWSDFVQYKNMRPIAFGDNTPIELRESLEYVFLLLIMERELTQEEFAGVLPYLDEAFKKAEKDKIIPPGVVQKVATAFSVPQRPPIPDQFADEIEDNAVIKTYLQGHTSFLVKKEHVEMLFNMSDNEEALTANQVENVKE